MIEKSETQINRASLRFAELAQGHFAFLEAQGFRCVRSESTFVRFESPSLFVNVYHGRSSFEIGAELGRLGKIEDERQPYPISALLRAAGVATAKEYRDYATHTPDGVNEGLEKLAKLFRTHVSKDFLQNVALFGLLKAQREAWGKEFAHEVNLQQARKMSEVAWREKDYAKVIELLLPLSEDLTPSELKKLEYAKRKLKFRSRIPGTPSVTKRHP